MADWMSLNCSWELVCTPLTRFGKGEAGLNVAGASARLESKTGECRCGCPRSARAWKGNRGFPSARGAPAVDMWQGLKALGFGFSIESWSCARCPRRMSLAPEGHFWLGAVAWSCRPKRTERKKKRVGKKEKNRSKGRKKKMKKKGRKKERNKGRMNERKEERKKGRKKETKKARMKERKKERKEGTKKRSNE